MSSSPASGSGVCVLLASPARFPPPYFMEQYIAQEVLRHDVRRFILLPSYLWRLSTTHNHHSWDTAAGAWRKKWKQWGELGTSEFRTASLDMDIPFIRCAVEVGYQRRLAAFLATLRRDGAAPAVPDVAFSCFDEE